MAASLAIHAAIVGGLVATRARSALPRDSAARIEVAVSFGERRLPPPAASAPAAPPQPKPSKPSRPARRAPGARTAAPQPAPRALPAHAASPSPPVVAAMAPGSRWVAAVHLDRLAALPCATDAGERVARVVRGAGLVLDDDGRLGGKPIDLVLMATPDPFAVAEPLVAMKIRLGAAEAQEALARGVNKRTIVQPSPGLLVSGDGGRPPSWLTSAAVSPDAGTADAGAAHADAALDGEHAWDVLVDLVDDAEEAMGDGVVATLIIDEVFRAPRWQTVAGGAAGALAGPDLPRAITVTLTAGTGTPSLAVAATFAQAGDARAWSSDWARRSRALLELTGLALPLERVGVDQSGDSFRVETPIPFGQIPALLEIMLRATRADTTPS